MACVLATYLGFWDCQRHIDLMMAGAHVTPEFREKYVKYVNWNHIPKKYISTHFEPPNQIRTSEDHVTILNQLGFTESDEISHVISNFEAGLADPLNFPLMASDLSNLPPAYILACEHDTLRDDALLYAKRLGDSGNGVVLDYQSQGWHGYIAFATGHLTVTSAVNVLQHITQFIKGHTPRDS